MSSDPRSRAVDVHRVEGDSIAAAPDRVAVEEPLEIRLRYRRQGQLIDRPLALTMRTPGHDAELAVGFLAGEGMVRSPGDVFNVEVSVEESATVTVDLLHGAEADLGRLQRNFYATSSCGICGRASLEAVEVLLSGAPPVDPLPLETHRVVGLPARLREAQSVFAATGGLHAAALFTAQGELLACREDVGRHNALDKLIGSQVLSGSLPLAHTILLLSGRASFELLQKAVMAGIPAIAAVGAPSSLAVDVARRFNRTLIGFLRDHRFNVYAGQVNRNK